MQMEEGRKGVIDNEGKVNSRGVNKYDDNVMLSKRASYRGDEKRLSTIAYELDSNEMSLKNHDTMIKYSYAYEIRRQGNWTKQTIKSVVKTRGKPSKYDSVTYRKLSYY